jgi:hypothetical protein
MHGLYKATYFEHGDKENPDQYCTMEPHSKAECTCKTGAYQNNKEQMSCRHQLRRGEDEMMMTFNQLRMTINSIANQQKQNKLNCHHQHL